jgi:hypothetical protein
LRCVLVAIFVLFSFAVADAQTKLFVLLTGATGSLCTWTDCEPSYVVEIDVERRRILAQTIVSNVREDSSPPSVTPDGRYLMWGGQDSPISPHFFSVFDNMRHATWAAVRLSNATLTPSVYAHPTRTRAYVLDGNQVRVLEIGGARSFGAGCEYPRLTALSSDGSRLMTHCVVTSPGTTRVFDSETGTVIATLAETSFIGELNATGTELFTVDSAPGPMQVRRYDVATGALLRSSVIGNTGEFTNRMALDPRTGHLYVSLSTSSEGAIIIIDSSTLAERARLATAISPRVTFVADSPRAFVVSRTETNPRRPGTRLTMIDTDRLVVEEQIDLPVTSGPAGAIVAPKPMPVQNVSSVVTGRQVNLQWTAPLDPTHWAFRIEVGFTPGATDLSVDVPPQSMSYSVSSVPPGTYYVRLRALNAVTSSVASNEVRVDVSQ